MVSLVILAERGITAGSGSATHEMRLLMINVVDALYKVFPQVTPCVFVDDIAADTEHEDAEVVKTRLANFLRSICCRLTADGLEVSATKSVVTASTRELGEGIANKLKTSGWNSPRR